MSMDKRARKEFNNTIITAKAELRDYAEILWFKGQKHHDEGNPRHGIMAHDKYHELHNLIKELESYQL